MSILLGSERAHAGVSRFGQLLRGSIISAVFGVMLGCLLGWWLTPINNLTLVGWQISKSYWLRQFGVPWNVPVLTDPADLLDSQKQANPANVSYVRRLPAASLDAFCSQAWHSKLSPIFINAGLYVASGAGITVAIWLLVLTRLSEGAKSRDLKRGAKLVDPSVLSDLACRKSRAQFVLAGIPVPGDVFYRHCLLLGTPGSGKSQLIGDLLDQARRRGEKVILFDPGAEFLSTHGQSADRILNPFDARSQGWNVLREIRNQWDADAISNSLIQRVGGQQGSGNDFFYDGARIVLAEALKRYEFRDPATMPDIFTQLATSPVSQLYKRLQGTPAAPFLDLGAKAQGSGIQATLNSKLSAWQYLQNGDFSIRDWIRSGSGWLFLTSREDAHAALQPLISLWLEIAVTELLCRPSNEGQRIWIVVDELASLQKMPALLRILSMGRKYRTACVLATQNPSQLQGIYGREGANALMGTVGNRCVFRLEDHEDAEAASKYFGQAEIEERKESQNMGARQQGSNLSEERRTEQIIMASQIQGLPDLQAYLKLSGGLPPAKTKQRYIKRKRVTEPFQECRVTSAKLEPSKRNKVPVAAEPPARNPAPVESPDHKREEASKPKRFEDYF